MSTPPRPLRFAVALSFPGEMRGFVKEVADYLASSLTRQRVLYDKFHEAEFARVDLDVYLPTLYREHAALLVVFLCSEYITKRWCNLEWRHIRQLICTENATRVMLVSNGSPGDLTSAGILPGDGYMDISGKSPEEVGRKILERLEVDAHGSKPPKPAATVEHHHLPAVNSKGTARLSRGIYGNLPGRSTVFVGRDDTLAHLQSVLVRETHARVAPSVEGLAGVGKTELVQQLVYKLDQERAFGGGIFWLDAERADLTAFWAQIADVYGGIPEGQPVERANALVHHLSRISDPVLVVLDNLGAWQGSNKPAPLPDGSHVRFLVTTRVKDLGGTQFQHVEVGTLEAPDDARLLTSIAGRTPEGIEALLEHLSGHALSLELAGAFLRRYKTFSAFDYLNALTRPDDGEDPEAKVSDRVRYEGTVEQAFTAVWTRLAAPEQRAWQLAAWLAPESASPELGRVVGLEDDVRSRLEDWHLLKITGAGQFRMHRLVQAYGQRAGSPDEQRDARRRFVLGCAQRAQLLDAHDGFVLYMADRAHFDLALDQAANVLGEEHVSVWRLRTQVGFALQSLGNYAEARRLLEQALDSVVPRFPEYHDAVTNSRSLLAGICKDLGELARARKLLEQVLDSARTHPETNQFNVANWQSELAMVLLDLRDPDELPLARQLMEHSLLSALQHADEDPATLATRRCNLAAVLSDLEDFTGARELLEQALAGEVELLGEDHFTVATTRANLALVLKDLEEYAGARELLETALNAALHIVADHPSVATWRANLAMVLLDLRSISDALSQADEAARIVQALPVGSPVRTSVEDIVAHVRSASAATEGSDPIGPPVRRES